MNILVSQDIIDLVQTNIANQITSNSNIILVGAIKPQPIQIFVLISLIACAKFYHDNLNIFLLLKISV